MFVGIGTSFGRKCYLAHSKASSNVEFDETFLNSFPCELMTAKGQRDSGIFEDQEQHGHEVRPETQETDDVINIIKKWAHAYEYHKIEYTFSISGDQSKNTG